MKLNLTQFLKGTIHKGHITHTNYTQTYKLVSNYINCKIATGLLLIYTVGILNSLRGHLYLILIDRCKPITGIGMGSVRINYSSKVLLKNQITCNLTDIQSNHTDWKNKWWHWYSYSQAEMLLMVLLFPEQKWCIWYYYSLSK